MLDAEEVPCAKNDGGTEHDGRPGRRREEGRQFLLLGGVSARRSSNLLSKTHEDGGHWGSGENGHDSCLKCARPPTDPNKARNTASDVRTNETSIYLFQGVCSEFIYSSSTTKAHANRSRSSSTSERPSGPHCTSPAPNPSVSRLAQYTTS